MKVPSWIHRGVWPTAALLAGVAAAVPLWCSRFLPYQDAPQHLAAVTVLAGRGLAADASRRFFQIDFANAQYSGVYLAAASLARIVGPDTAIRLLLSAVALLLPLAAWMLLGSFGRDRRLAVFAPVLFQTVPLFIGLYNFVAAVPVAIIAVALAERQLQRPSLARAFLLAAVSFLLLHLHPSGFVVALAAAAVLAWTRRNRPAFVLLPFGPALLQLASWTVHGPRPEGPRFLQARATWQPLWLQINDLLRFGNVFPGRVDEVFVFLVVAAFVAVVAQRAPPPREARAYRMPLLAVGVLAAYLVAPQHLGYVAYIHLRAIPFVFLFALASPLTARTRRTAGLLAAVTGLQILYAPYVADRYRRFDREVDAPRLERVLSAAAPGQRLVSLVLDRKSQVVHFEPYLHFGLYYEVLRGGRARFNFGELPWMPVRFREDVSPAQPYPVRWEFDVGSFDWRKALPDADYILVRTPDPSPEADAWDGPEPGPEFAAGWQLKERAGRWEVFAHPAAPRRVSARRPAR